MGSVGIGDGERAQYARKKGAKVDDVGGIYAIRPLPGPITAYAGINFSVEGIYLDLAAAGIVTSCKSLCKYGSNLEEVSIGGGAKAKEIGGIETI